MNTIFIILSNTALAYAVTIAEGDIQPAVFEV